jgi:O-antigen/teichoic acid export membrane protein
MPLLKKFLHNSFIKGGFYVTTATMIVNCLNYLFNLLTAHSLGPIAYGEIIALISYLTILTGPFNIFSTLIIQNISAHGKEDKEFAGRLERIFWKKINYWRWLIFLLLAIIPFVPQLTNLQPLTAYFLLPIVIVSFLGTFYSALNQGLQLFLWFSLISIIATNIKLIGALFSFFHLGGLLIVLSFLFLSYLTAYIGNYLTFAEIKRRHLFNTTTKAEKRLIHIIKNPQFIITFFSLLAMILFNNIDVIFVKKHFSSTTAGLYSSWSLCAKIIYFLVSPLVSVSFVYFSGQSRPDKKKQLLYIVLSLILLISLICFFTYIFLGKIFINILFGTRFLAILPDLNLAAIFGGLYATIMLFNNYFLAQKSKSALLIACTLPSYLILLFIFAQQLQQIMYLNIFFSAAIIIIYLTLFLKSL